MRAFTVVLARVGLLLITVVTFITSFDAVSEVAVELEAVAPNLGWTIPLALDGLIVVGSAVLWSESMEDRWHLFPLITVVAAAILSVTANIAHAGTDSLLGQALAGVPPVALILAVELAAWQIRRSIRRNNQQQSRAAEAAAAPVEGAAPVAAVPAVAPAAPAPETVPAPAPAPAPVPAPAPAPVPAPRAEPAAVTEDRQLWERILELVKDQPARPSEAAVARALNEPRAAVRRAIASRREEWDRLGSQPSGGTPVGAGRGATAAP